MTGLHACILARWQIAHYLRGRRRCFLAVSKIRLATLRHLTEGHVGAKVGMAQITQGANFVLHVSFDASSDFVQGASRTMSKTSHTAVLTGVPRQ